MPSEPTLTQLLLRRVRSGDRDALNELYNRYELRVLAAVRARLGAELRQKVESWDIVQDAMMASLNNVADFDNSSDGAFMKWLVQIAENRIRDKIDYFHAASADLRQEKPAAAARSPDSSLPLEIPDKSGIPSPSRVLMLNEDLARLERAMDRLPQEVRDLVAVKIEEQTYQEIGDALGKSTDAVRMQVNRAMAALTRAFQELEAGGSGT